MASIITEVFVSIDNLEFTKLDLFKDESITIKSSKKDLQDISKVFAPYSQSFSFPATPKNVQAFGFFGNTEVIKVNPDNKFYCKIYTNGVLNNKGIIKIENVKYKNNKADSFSGSFNTNMLSLKDRIGDDTLQDLTNLDFSLNWKPNNVFNRLKNTAVLSNSGINVKYFVPLISNNRVWTYNSVETGIDNIAYKSVNAPTGNKVVNIGELRPAVSFQSVLDLIKYKYNLEITTPLEAKDEIKDLYIWCNASSFTKNTSSKFILKKQYVNESPSAHGTAVVNFADSSTKITKNGTSPFAVTYIQYRITLVDTVIGDDQEKATVVIDIQKKSTLQNVLSFEFEVKNGNNQLAMKIPLYLFTSNEFEFYTYLKSSKPILWKYSSARVLYRNLLSDKVSTFTNNNNSDDSKQYEVDLVKSLPNTKVIDFITSYFKTFNISIFDSSPTDDKLFWLTPQDINTIGQVYSKREVDYTRFVDVKEVLKSVGNDYNYYNFKHAESKYRSNVDFKKQFGMEFGQTKYPSIPPTKPNEFKIETHFSIIPPVLLNGTSQIWTAYGFDNSEPNVSDDGVYRYTPNTDELTLFYSHGNTSITETIGVQNLNSSDVLITSELTSHMKVMPYCKSNNYSLGFSILKIDNIEYTDSLFLLYYSTQIVRLLNPNALSQTFKVVLPSNEIYLNDATTLIGSGSTPVGFRMQNEIIIGETKYEILDSSIDITTGKGTLTLLNF